MSTRRPATPTPPVRPDDGEAPHLEYHPETAAVLREVFRRIFDVHAGNRQYRHRIAYYRMCAIAFCLVDDDTELLETLQPAVVARRVGSFKQNVAEGMIKFAHSIGLGDVFERRRRGDAAHNRSRHIRPMDREPIFVLTPQERKNVLKVLAEAQAGREALATRPKRAPGKPRTNYVAR